MEKEIELELPRGEKPKEGKTEKNTSAVLMKPAGNIRGNKYLYLKTRSRFRSLLRTNVLIFRRKQV